MLRLFHSNRLENLAAALVPVLRARVDPFEPLSIVVPNRSIERWLDFRLAESVGISAHIHWQRLAGALLPASTTLWDRDAFEARLLSLLSRPDALVGDLAPLHKYLAVDGARSERERRTVQLAARLARSFVEYTERRPDLLEAWIGGGSTFEEDHPLASIERWQAELWRTLRAEQPERSTPDEALAKPGASSAPLCVFGVPFMNAVWLDGLTQRAQHSDVFVYSLNPSMEFWEDARSARELRRAGREAEVDDSHDSLLLRAFGRPGREYLARLDERSGFDAEAHFVAAEGESQLARLQRSILQREPVAPGEPDATLRIFACPSLRREVETLAEDIWASVAEGASGPSPHRWNDIQVLIAGNRSDAYLAHIRSVFAEAQNLPWNTIERSLRSHSMIAEGIDRLLRLFAGRFERRAVLDVLTHPNVLARYPEADGERVVELCTRLGAYFGIDEEDLEGTYLGNRNLVHWDQAVRRLALGALVDESAEPFPHDNGALWAEPIDLSDDVAVGLGLWVRSLSSDHRFAQKARLSLTDWATFIGGLVRSYLVPLEAEDRADCERCIHALSSLETLDGGGEVGIEVALELSRRALDALTSSHGELLGNGVRVAKLAPGQTVPASVVYVLGLSEDSFPTREIESGLELTSAGRKALDVTLEERDRYAFLEALLAARSTLTLSYVARDETTGEAREPSSVLSSLIEAVPPGITRATPALWRHERGTTQAFEAIRTSAIPSVPSEIEARMLGVRRRSEGVDLALRWSELFDLPLDERERTILGLHDLPQRESETLSEPSSVSLDSLRKFLACPIQGYARHLIGGFDVDDRDDRDEPPLSPVRQARKKVLLETIARLLAEHVSLEEAYQERVEEEVVRGTWPVGLLADRARAEDLRVLERWKAKTARWGSGIELSRVRFGEGRTRRSHLREHSMPAVRGGKGSFAIEGRTDARLPNGDSILFDPRPRGLGGEGERVTVARERKALNAFVDHAVLALAEGGVGARRCWLIDASDQPPLQIQLLSMQAAAAERWLQTLVSELESEAPVYFMPCEAVLCRSDLFGAGNSDPEGALARTIERVRTRPPYNGGSSRWGPVRDALEYPAPEPALALSLSHQRFGAYFDHRRILGPSS